MKISLVTTVKNEQAAGRHHGMHRDVVEERGTG